MILPGGTFLASGGHAGSGFAASAAAGPSAPSGALAFNNAHGSSPSRSSSPALPASSLYSGLSPTFANQPWVRSLAGTGPATHPLTSLPSINILKGKYTSVSAAIAPGYTSPPAPLGLGDFGLGANTYSYNTSHILGEITFNTPPNATNPGATGLILPNPGGSHEGAIGSPYTFGIQLNTIATNITVPGNNADFLWTQNVVNWNDTGIHMVQDTFNASGPAFQPGTIVSACNNNSAGVQNILEVYGGVLQCVLGSIPVSPASYPVTLQLYNNASVNSDNQSQISYGYRIVESGTGKVYTGISDTVVFNNPNSTAPANQPGFSIDGFDTTPAGFLRDAEIVIVGGIGGDNAAFRSINGTINLEYSNQSSGGWQSVPSAYNFGGDTGETSVGIADYWTPSHTLVMNTGPAMMYGLWNAVPYVSVHSGDMQIAGSINPSYGFVFVGNTAPDVYGTNLSWLPTTATGSFNTYLPPLTAPWTTTYYLQAFAPDSAEQNLTVTASTTSLAIALTSAPGVLRAPFYAFSNAQAASLAKNVSGSSTAPFVFNGLVDDMNFTFNHVNDYTYPSFALFMAQGVTDPIYVNNTTQGEDTAFGNYLFYTSPSGPPGLLSPPGQIIPVDVGPFLAQVDIYGGTHDKVSNETMYASGFGGRYALEGGEVQLWQDTDAFIWNNTAVDESQGIWVGMSLDTTVAQMTEVFADGVQDIGSTGTVVWNLTATEDGIGVSAYGTTDATYSWVNVSYGAIGIEAGQDEGEYGDYGLPYYNIPGAVGMTINELNVTTGGLGFNITLSQHTTINAVSVNDYYDDVTGGGNLDATWGTTINSIVASQGEAWGFDEWNATYTNVTNYTLENAFDYGSDWDLSSYTSVTNFTIFDYFVGVFSDASGGYLTGTTITNANVSDSDIGFDLFNAADTTFNGLAVYETDEGVYMWNADPTTFTNVDINDVDVGIYVDHATGTSITDLNATDVFDTAGAELYDADGTTLTGITGNGSMAVYQDVGNSTTVKNVLGTGDIEDYAVELTRGNSATISGVAANDLSGGVELDTFTSATVTGVSATDESAGLEADVTSHISVSTVTASDQSIGVSIFDSQWDSVNTVTVSNLSIGVASVESDYTYISGVTATNTTLSGPWSIPDLFGEVPASAVATEEDSLDTISNVQATDYPVAYFDDDSYAPGVTNVNATSGYYGVYLNYTYDGVFSDLGMYKDWVGVQIDYADYDDSDNVFTMSSFVDCTSYAIAFYYSYDNLVYENNFIGNNGATGTYSAAHIQVYSGGGYGDYNYWDAGYELGVDIGNYWSDWHSYNSYGSLAPYPIGDENYDYYPLGGPEGSVAVTFEESGLASGVTWSVTLGTTTESTANGYLTFYVLPGTLTFTVGAVAGYSESPSSGSVVAVGSSVYEVLTYVAQYNVTVSESGLPADTSWTATVGGVSATGTGNVLTLALGSGTYAYQITPVPGYTASPSSGTITVGTSSYNLVVTFTAVTYAVTVTESGLASGQSWSATVNGEMQSSTGTSITYYLANGSYAFSAANVSGYSITAGGSGTLKVAGAAAGVSVTFASTTTSSSVSTDTFNTWFAVAIAIAVIALVLALLAVFLRRRREDGQPAQGAQPWTPPPASGSPAAPAAGGSGSWSEGPPPSGGSPPSS